VADLQNAVSEAQKALGKVRYLCCVQIADVNARHSVNQLADAVEKKLFGVGQQISAGYQCDANQAG